MPLDRANRTARLDSDPVAGKKDAPARQVASLSDGHDLMPTMADGGGRRRGAREHSAIQKGHGLDSESESDLFTGTIHGNAVLLPTVLLPTVLYPLVAAGGG